MVKSNDVLEQDQVITKENLAQKLQMQLAEKLWGCLIWLCQTAASIIKIILTKCLALLLFLHIEGEAEEIEDESIIAGFAKVQPAKSESIPTEVTPDNTVLKIKALINLMKVDKKITTEERNHIETLIEHSEIDTEAKIDLANLMDIAGKIPVDFSLFGKEPDEAVGLLFDLIGLAKRDGEFHLSEKIYIKQAGKLMGISEIDIEGAMAI
jgi:uncharacterized tellurite resistance protein B-like protein